MFRLLHLINILLIVPMMACGFMSMMSGGGQTPIYQDLGILLLMASPVVGIASVLLAEVIWRLAPNLRRIAVLIDFMPIMMWAGLMIWLQVETGFFG